MANNINNGITGVIDIPGALRSRGAADGNLVGGVVAYAGDIYDTTLGKNQSQINQEFSDSLSSSENANTSRPIKLYLTGNNSEYSVNINYVEGTYEEALGHVFAATCVDEYLLDSDTLEQVAQITNITSSDDVITITTDNNLGQLENALYVLLSVEGTDSMCSGSFVDKSDNGVIYGSAIFNSEDSKESVLVGSVVSNDGDYSTVIGGANFNNGNDSTIIGNDNTNASEKNTIIGYGNSSSESRSSVLIGHNLNLTDGMGVRLGNYNVETSPNNYFAVSGRINRVAQNILEQHTDGSLYIKGLGGFNGTNSTVTDIKSLQDVITGINTRVTTLENSPSSPVTESNGGYVLGNTSSALSGSFAEGYQTEALGNYSHAEGDSTTASGDYSHAEGDSTTASGDYSHAEGRSTTASENYSHAEGYSTTASGNYSHAEGDNGIALNESSHSEGSRTFSYGIASHSEGNDSLASGKYSHAEGQKSRAIGGVGHAEGVQTIAYGKGSHAEGYGDNDLDTTKVSEISEGPEGLCQLKVTASSVQVGDILYSSWEVKTDASMRMEVLEILEETSVFTLVKINIPASKKSSIYKGRYYVLKPSSKAAYGAYSHVEGCRTTASGDYSHAEGSGTETTNEAEHASGMYNKSTLNVTLFSVGVGGSNRRANAFEIDVNGNVYIKGIGTYDGMNIGQNGVKSVQQVIADLTLQIAALTNNL